MTNDPYTITEDEMPSMNHTRKCGKCGARMQSVLPASEPEMCRVCGGSGETGADQTCMRCNGNGADIDPVPADRPEPSEALRQKQKEWLRLLDTANNGPLPACRDCADKDGRCDDGLPCDPTDRAVEQIEALRKSQHAPAVPIECVWHKPDPEEEEYEAQCGSAWVSETGMRLDEFPCMKYCSNCGGRIRIAASTPTDDGEK